MPDQEHLAQARATAIARLNASDEFIVLTREPDTDEDTTTIAVLTAVEGRTFPAFYEAMSTAGMKFAYQALGEMLAERGIEDLDLDDTEELVVPDEIEVPDTIPTEWLEGGTT